MYTDLLIKIKNAQRAEKKLLKHQYSRMDKAIVDILERNGFVGDVEVKGRLSKRVIFVNLDGKRKIENLKFLSKPSLHSYLSYKDIRRVKGGFGILIISTSRGIMTGKQARLEKIGGEALFEVW